MLGDQLWKNPFLTHFSHTFGARLAHFFQAFWDFEQQKQATTDSKRAKTTCFGIPHGLGSFLVKNISCASNGPR